MAVRKLANGKWIADVVVGVRWDGKPDRRSKCCDTKAKAVKEERKLLLVKEQARGGVTTSMTLAEFVELAYWPQCTVRPNTRRGYERDLRLRILPALGSTPLDQINRAMVQRMISGCPTRKTATNARETLSAVLGAAMGSGLVAANVARMKYKYPAPGEHAKDHYGEWLTSAEQHAKLLRFVSDRYPGQPEERICVLGLCFGLRKGEIMGLDWEDVDLEARMIRITKTYVTATGGAYIADPKTANAFRVIPMSDYAYGRMSAWSGRAGAVVTGADGKRMSPQTASSRIRKMVRGGSYDDGEPLPNVTIHSLRHSFATGCINAGIPVSKVSKLLGHCDTAITEKVYIKQKTEEMAPDMALLDAAYSSA